MFYNIINAEMYPFQVFIILTVEKSALFTTSFVFHFQILDLTQKGPIIHRTRIQKVYAEES